jgi:KaiC/GvpD/RAD55 family RecA-like ATPase
MEAPANQRRVSSGVDGLNQLIEGGFLEKSVNVISGTPGTGKTILGLQYLIDGAMKGERGIYIALEESIEDISTHVEKFGWDIVTLAKNDAIRFHQFKITPIEFVPFQDVKTTMKQYKHAEPPSIIDIYYSVKDEIEKGGFKRAVVDSISLLKYSEEEAKSARAELASLFRFFKNSGLTSVFITERRTPEDIFAFEDFLADCVIILGDYPAKEERKRGITVLKMRGSSCDRTTRPYFISDKGIVVYPSEHML